MYSYTPPPITQILFGKAWFDRSFHEKELVVFGVYKADSAQWCGSVRQRAKAVIGCTDEIVKPAAGRVLFPPNRGHTLPHWNIKSISVHLAVMEELLTAEVFLELHDTQQGWWNGDASPGEGRTLEGTLSSRGTFVVCLLYSSLRFKALFVQYHLLLIKTLWVIMIMLSLLLNPCRNGSAKMTQVPSDKAGGSKPRAASQLPLIIPA